MSTIASHFIAVEYLGNR